MIFTTFNRYAQASGLAVGTVYNYRLKGARQVAGYREKLFYLLEAIPTLKRSEMESDVLERLFANAYSHRTHFAAPDTAFEQVCEFEDALSPAQKGRLWNCRLAFSDALARRLKLSELFLFHSRNVHVLPYRTEILKHIALGTPDYSDWPTFSVQWAISNSSHEEMYIKTEEPAQ